MTWREAVGQNIVQVAIVALGSLGTIAGFAFLAGSEWQSIKKDVSEVKTSIEKIDRSIERIDRNIEVMRQDDQTVRDRIIKLELANRPDGQSGLDTMAIRSVNPSDCINLSATRPNNEPYPIGQPFCLGNSGMPVFALRAGERFVEFQSFPRVQSVSGARTVVCDINTPCRIFGSTERAIVVNNINLATEPKTFSLSIR